MLRAILSIVAGISFSTIGGLTPSAAQTTEYSWTGFYVGGHLGYGWADKDWTFVTGSMGLTCAGVLAANNRCDNSHSPDGVLGGAQAGFNYQIGNWLMGVEGQWSWTDWHASSALSNDGTDRFHTRVNWAATGAVRVGWAINRALLYVKGGGALANEKHWLADLGGEYLNAPATTRAGWMVGLGGEYAFKGNWSAKIEYDFMDFGSKNYNLVDVTGGGYFEEYDVDQQIQIIKVGVNYRFGPNGLNVAN
jgi:outer membrane immunogenic protein